MRVALDVREVYKPERRGMGKTLVDLYGTLAARRPDWRFVLFHQLPGSAPEFEALPTVRRFQLDFPGVDRLGLWERGVLPAAAAVVRADVLHSPANTGPPRGVVPTVVTVHDLIPLDIAPNAPRTKTWAKNVAAMVRVARHITTPSEYSKRRIVERLAVPPGQVTVNPWAPHRSMRRVDDVAAFDAIRQKYGLRAGEPYLFAFGAIDPRKNTREVLRAYASLPAGLRAEFRLLVVGITEAALPEFRGYAESLGVGDRAAVHGFTPDADIPPLLSGAAALAFPSRCEGFGLPILDAFACGTPVLTGDNSSLPEVAGDAALLVDAENIDAIRDGLARLLGDESLRRTLVVRGSQRLMHYSWDRAAEVIARVFEAIASGGGGG